jgi:hypothetical protein
MSASLPVQKPPPRISGPLQPVQQQQSAYCPEPPPYARSPILGPMIVPDSFGTIGDELDVEVPVDPCQED